MQEVEVLRFVQRQNHNGSSISLRIVAPINQLADWCLAAPWRKSSAHLSSDRARQKERSPLLNARDTGGRGRGALASGPIWRSGLGAKRSFENVRILELSAEDAAPVLKKYLTQVPVVRPFFDVTPKSNLRDFVAEASRHPVFRID